MEIFVPLFKVDTTRREVHGVIASEAKDSAGEVFDYVSSKPFFVAWSEAALQRTTAAGQQASLGNVREQHNSKIVAGKLQDVQYDDTGHRISVIAKIVDGDCWRKVEEGALTGFSIAGSYVKRWPDGGAMRYTAKPSEVSIVDNPCNPEATFTLVKANGAFEYRGFAGAPSNPTSELDRLRIQVRGQMNELMTKINALIANRTAGTSQSAKFNTKGVQKSDEEVRGLLNKALDNGKPVTFQTQESQSARFQPNGVEKSDVAAAELEKSLASPIRIG
jgi:hypothetical protein